MRKVSFILGVSILALLILAFLEYKGYIWHNAIFAMKYEVKGLDVSHHQGYMNWELIDKEEDCQFVFIKATEGRDFIDDKFEYNWKEAKKQGILTGAYHFFSMGSTGDEQAIHFINTVPKEKDNLPPVIDLEIHLNHKRDNVRQQLWNMILALEKFYGVKPSLYVTYDTYNTYIKGDFDELDIWIRDVIKFPTLGKREWLLWQYSNRGRIDGVDAYIDKNVFNGSLDEFKKKFLTK